MSPQKNTRNDVERMSSKIEIKYIHSTFFVKVQLEHFHLIINFGKSNFNE
jgi:hypothetical protein